MKGVALTPLSRIRHHISALNEDSGGTTLVNIIFPRFFPDSGYHPSSNGLNMNVLTLMISSCSTNTTISQLTFDELPLISKNHVLLCASYIKNIINLYMIYTDDTLNSDGSGASLIVSSLFIMTSFYTYFVFV